MECRNPQKRTLVGISELVDTYLPMSKRKARKFAKTYLNPIWIGNQMYVERELLEALLDGISGNKFPLGDVSEVSQE